MPIRKPHIGKGVVTKRHVEDALKFTALDHITLCKGAGAGITGNAGTTYAELGASQAQVDPSRYKQVRLVEAMFIWIPQTTAGGIRLYNVTDGVEVAKSEPGTTTWRVDTIDITTTWKGIEGVKLFVIQTKGDGTTAPTVDGAVIVVETGNI